MTTPQALGRAKDLTGMKFGTLTVKAFLGRRGELCRLYWLCECACGKTSEVQGLNLSPKRTCRFCARKRRADYHGGRQTKEWSSWNAMIVRCTRPNSASYRFYGGRGIGVCERWLNSFPNFLADMGPCPPGFCIDRIDNDGNYEPNNCRWASRKEQASNRRSCLMYTYQGQTLCVEELADKTGVVTARIIRQRIHAGWPIEKAITTPRTR